MSGELSATIKIEGTAELDRALSKLEDLAASQYLAQAGMAGALVIQNAAKVKAPRKTRTLSRSIHSEVTSSSRDSATVEIGTDLEYAAIQEFGGTITAKKGKFLAIPLDYSGENYGPRSYPGKLHFVGDDSGGVLMDAAGVAHFALTPSVTLPAQPYMRPALAENEYAAGSAAGRVLKRLIESVSE